MNTAERLVILLIGLVIGFVGSWYIKVPEHGRNSYVTDKFEVGDKCYFVVELEVNPNDYIGVDKGDDYMIKEDFNDGIY